MKTITLILSLIISGIIVTGCGVGSPLAVDFGMLTKKTSIADLSKAYPTLRFPSVIQANSTDYKVFSIEVLTSRRSEDRTYMDGNRTRTSTTLVSHFDKYFIVFHNDYYIYSGFLYEFLNSNDQSIKGIGATLRSTFGTEGRTMKI